MSYDFIIWWFPVVCILFYIPHYCRMDLKLIIKKDKHGGDIKTREIPHKEWMPFMPLLGATAMLYAMGFYPLECLEVAIIMVAVWFVVMKLNLIEGADFIFLSIISLLVAVNPISGRILMPVVVAEFLVTVFLIVNIFAFCFRKKIDNFPMIPVISAAFILAVMLG